MEKIKVCNLYCGIGGNRKLWDSVRDDLEITAVENVPEIAKIYQDFFPKDKVIIADAHQYLLDHFKEFDFIWSSPPCPSHSAIRKASVIGNVHNGQNKAIYPDLKLYEEILFLQGYFKGKYVVENVISWYEPLIKPQKLQRHYFWANFNINHIKVKEDSVYWGTISKWEKIHGVSLSKYKNIDKRAILRNMVNSELSLHIFQEAFREYKTLF